MLYFPQLLSGALTQYPLTKQSELRTVVNDTAGGQSFKWQDLDFPEATWELRHRGLADDELATLEDFFRAVEGRLKSFTFLDPTNNMLHWSEDPDAATWTRGPFLQVQPAADPLGTMRASRLTNSGAAEQFLEQTLVAPGWFRYCFSFQARADSAASIVIHRIAGSYMHTTTVPLTSSWKPVLLSGKFDGSEETVTFGIRIPVGAAVDVFGLQAQPQVNPSPYRKTTTRNGVHSSARFSDDSLRIVSQHINQHSAVIRILAPIGA